MRVAMVVANPVVFDGRVMRHAQTLSEAGHRVTVLGVIGPNDRDGQDIALPPGVGFDLRRLSRRRQGLVPRLIWAETAARQRAAMRLCERLPPSWLARVPVLADLAVSTSGPELCAMLLRGRYDVFHGNDLNTLPAVAWAAALRGRPYLYDAHEFYIDEDPGLSEAERRARTLTEGRLSQGAAAVLTVNELIAEELSRIHGIALPVVVRNLPPLCPAPAPALGRVGSLRLLYHAANIGLLQLGTDDILRAMARLPALDLHLTLRGRITDSERTALWQRVDELALRGRVDVCPPVPGAVALVAEAVAGGEEVGLAVHPPACGSYSFTTSSKVYEYQMAGLAVCATDVVGNRLTVDSRAGLFYPAGDDAQLAAHLFGLAQDRERLLSLRQAARARAVAELCWERERDVLLGVYAGLVSQGARA